MGKTRSAPRATVHVPPALRYRTEQAATVDVSGGTVREVIEALDAAYPGFKFNLCDETGALRRYVNLFLDGRNVRYLDDLETAIPAGATLRILQSVAGG